MAELMRLKFGIAVAGSHGKTTTTSMVAAILSHAHLDPTIVVRPDDRYVDDGNMITSQGVSAGIDMALHLVARLGGAARAEAVKRSPRTKLLKRMLRIRCPLQFGCVCLRILNVQHLTAREKVKAGK